MKEKENKRTERERKKGKEVESGKETERERQERREIGNSQGNGIYISDMSYPIGSLMIEQRV